MAITSKKPHQMRGYYNTVFDARLSDYIDETISGVKLKIRFLRVNQRHHSVAIAAVNRLPVNPIRTRVQHVNIQVADLDDMTASYQRVKELGFHMALAVGQHTNDKELSYYAMTPSGFEWEVGWNPIVVDENTWEPTTYQGISIWGHTPEGQTIIDKLAQFKTGVAVAGAPRGQRPGTGRRRHPRQLMRKAPMLRIDTHHHLIPPDYRKALQKAGIDEAGGRALPDWSPRRSLQTMAELNIGTAILSVSTPGTTFLPKPPTPRRWPATSTTTAPGSSRRTPERFGFFATVPMPHIDESVAEAVRALDDLNADGVVLLANNAGTYLGQEGQDDLFAALDARSAVVFVHPADLPGPTVPVSRRSPPTSCSTPPAPHTCWCATAFAASTPTSGSSSATRAGSSRTRRTGWPSRSWPTPAAVPRTASTTSPASTSTPRCRPARPRCRHCSRSRKPGHITFGSDWPFAPVAAGQYFAAGLETYDGLDDGARAAIERTNALALFPRLGTAPQPIPVSGRDRAKAAIRAAGVTGDGESGEREERLGPTAVRNCGECEILLRIRDLTAVLGERLATQNAASGRLMISSSRYSMMPRSPAEVRQHVGGEERRGGDLAR